jgi:hypothetical protein
MWPVVAGLPVFFGVLVKASDAEGALGGIFGSVMAVFAKRPDLDIR